MRIEVENKHSFGVDVGRYATRVAKKLQTGDPTPDQILELARTFTHVFDTNIDENDPEYMLGVGYGHAFEMEGTW